MFQNDKNIFVEPLKRYSSTNLTSGLLVIFAISAIWLALPPTRVLVSLWWNNQKIGNLGGYWADLIIHKNNKNHHKNNLQYILSINLNIWSM